MTMAIWISLAVLGTVGVFFYWWGILPVSVFHLPSKKESPRVSVVLIVKNNRNLLKLSLESLKRIKGGIHEIIVLDVGSLDSSMYTAQKILEGDERGRIYSIQEKTITRDYFATIKQYASGDMYLVMDLYKIGLANPNIYIPQLLKPLSLAISGRIAGGDPRIDGTNLLRFDNLEREKNGFLFNEYVIETLSNIRMRMESLAQKEGIRSEFVKSKLGEMLDYIDRQMKDVIMISWLTSPVKFMEKNINDNFLRIFKDYGQNRNISINFKVRGNERIFKDSVNQLILELTHDLLYAVIRHNLSTGVEAISHYGRGRFRLLFKYKGTVDEEKFLYDRNEISYYVLHSIQNRLSLIGGAVRFRVRRDGRVSFLMQLPLDETTCPDQKEEYYEKNN